MFNPQGFINSVKQEIVRVYSKNETHKNVFKIGNMFMITWVGEENPRRKKKDEEYQDAFRSVKLTGLTVEGAIFSDKFQLEDSTERMYQSDGFCLKISFYSDSLASKSTFSLVSPQDPYKVSVDPLEMNAKVKQLYNENTKESDRKLKVPIYKYKQRNDK